jgi:CubicO group peptidase (beta-lactamase class C family)
MTIDQIKSNLVAQFATSDGPARHLSERMTSSITTVSYQSARKTWQTEVVQKRDGIVAGVTGPQGRKVVTFGDPQVLNGDTVFEIGSITKVFTALLLCDMVRRNEVALSDPVSRYLPASTSVPRRSGRDISLADLATHTSGLPCLPSNMNRKIRRIHTLTTRSTSCTNSCPHMT